MRDRLKDEEISNAYEPKRDIKMFCYALVSEGVKGNKEAAERVSGVRKGKFYWLWRTEPRFRAWYHDLCLQILGTNAAIPPVALLGQIIRGDTQAIRTYYELIGKLKGNTVNVNTGDTTIIQTPHAVIFSALAKEPEESNNECQTNRL